MTKDMPKEPVEVIDDTFEEFVEEHSLAVIDCWADWCSPCKMMDPVLESVAEEMQEDIVVGKLNVDENKETSAQYGVRSIPTYLVFEDGEQIDSFVGAMPKESFKDKMESYM